MSTLRQDPISGGWVIFAEERALRPFDLIQPAVVHAGPTSCPFCEGHERLTMPEVAAYRENTSQPNEPGWTVRAVANKFPALAIEGGLGRHAQGLYDAMNGIGAHEVVIETPEHEKHMADYTFDHLTAVMHMYRDRVRDLYGDSRFRYIQIFKNHGRNAGASLGHAHSQVLAMPITPRVVKEELENAKRHFGLKERCLFCDVLDEETRTGERIVGKNAHFVAYAPYASKVAFEIWIMPRRHAHDFRMASDEELPALAEILSGTLSGLRQALDDPAFNLVFHSAPKISPERYPAGSVTIEKDYHWHLEIVPRTAQMAALEWGTGVFINSTFPEKAAAYLRGLSRD